MTERQALRFVDVAFALFAAFLVTLALIVVGQTMLPRKEVPPTLRIETSEPSARPGPPAAPGTLGRFDSLADGGGY